MDIFIGLIAGLAAVKGTRDLAIGFSADVGDKFVLAVLAVGYIVLPTGFAWFLKFPNPMAIFSTTVISWLLGCSALLLVGTYRRYREDVA